MAKFRMAMIYSDGVRELRPSSWREEQAAAIAGELLGFAVTNPRAEERMIITASPREGPPGGFALAIMREE